MFFVYILQSLSDGKYYIGHTQDLEQRVAYHNSGKVRSTRSRTPFKLIYYEELETRGEAYKRELEIKRMKGGIGFKKLIENR